MSRNMNMGIMLKNKLSKSNANTLSLSHLEQL